MEQTRYRNIYNKFYKYLVILFILFLRKMDWEFDEEQLLTYNNPVFVEQCKRRNKDFDKLNTGWIKQKPLDEDEEIMAEDEDLDDDDELDEEDEEELFMKPRHPERFERPSRPERPLHSERHQKIDTSQSSEEKVEIKEKDTPEPETLKTDFSDLDDIFGVTTTPPMEEPVSTRAKVEEALGTLEKPKIKLNVSKSNEKPKIKLNIKPK